MAAMIAGAKSVALKLVAKPTDPTGFAEWLLSQRVVKGTNAKSHEYYWPSQNEFLTIGQLHERWVGSQSQSA